MRVYNKTDSLVESTGLHDLPISKIVVRGLGKLFAWSRFPHGRAPSSTCIALDRASSAQTSLRETPRLDKAMVEDLRGSVERETGVQTKVDVDYSRDVHLPDCDDKIPLAVTIAFASAFSALCWALVFAIVRAI